MPPHDDKWQALRAWLEYEQEFANDDAGKAREESDYHHYKGQADAFRRTLAKVNELERNGGR